MRVATLCLLLTLAAFSQASFVGQKMQNKEVDMNFVLLDQEFMQFLKGMNVDNYLSNSTTCVTNFEYFMNTLIQSSNDLIFNPNKQSQFTLALEFTKALGNFKPFITTCWGVSDHMGVGVKTYFGQFTNRSQYIGCWFQNVMSKMFAIQSVYNEYNKCKAAKNFTGEAYQMGRLMRNLFDFKPCLMAPTPLDDIIEMTYNMNLGAKPNSKQLLPNIIWDVSEFLKGLMVGSQVLDTNNTIQCDTYIELFGNQTRSIGRDFRNMSVKAALMDLGDLLANLNPMLDSCNRARYEINNQFTKFSANVTVHQALMRMVYHFGRSYDAVKATLSAIMTNNPYDAGFALGKFLWIIFFK